jgi:hypothetical protein
MTRFAVVLAFTAFFLTRLHQLQKYVSPDKSVIAVITPAGPKKNESLVELRSSAGKVLFHKDYTSPDGTHGFGVVQAAWTPNSQFFIYSMEDSGDRAAWHSPTWFFSRKMNRMYSLDDALNDAVSFPDFKLVPPDDITVTLWAQGSMTKRTASLSSLLQPKTETPPTH